MPEFNPAGAAERLHTITLDGYTAGRNHPGECLRWNYYAVGAKPNLTPANIAMDAWNNAPAGSKHAIGADTVVPADHPIILGPVDHSRWAGDATYLDGDVVLADGSGVGLQSSVSATDGAGEGVIGRMTLAQRAAQTGRPVYGYLTSWLGYDLVSGEAAASVAATTVLEDPAASTPTLEEDEMELIVVVADLPATKTQNAKVYGSTAVITAHRGFVQTSTGLGKRDELNAWTAIANALSIPIRVKHVDANGFALAHRF